MTTTHIDYYEKLDSILGFFYSKRMERPVTMNAVLNSGIVPSDRQELSFLVQKLIQDNRIGLMEIAGLFEGTTHTIHKITLDGIMFYETTSYKKEYLKSLQFKPEKVGHDLSHSTITNSTVIFESSLNQSPIDNSQSVIQELNLDKGKGRIKTFLEKFWWTIAIPFAIGLTLLAIEYKWFSPKK